MNARAEELFDWKEPNYLAIVQARVERINRLRANPDMLPGLRVYYRTHPADFINDFGCTVDPRNVAIGRPTTLPFVLMPKQRELVDWIVERWRHNESALIEKSRDVGASWLFMALACTLCLFHDGMMIGVGSAKEDKLDRTGDPDTLFYKARAFMSLLPVEFRNGWDVNRDSLYLRLLFPATGSSITGEAGDRIGLGGRKAIYGVDESAFTEHPDLIEQSLIATTDCRIDWSSVNGMSNWFGMRRHSGRVPVFTYHYRDDLRKDDAWRDAKKGASDPVVWASQYELDYSASIEGVIIPQEWVQSAVDADKKLKLTPTGVRRGALDVADEGRDLNCFAARHGMSVLACEVWSGKNSDIFATTERAFQLCDDLNLDGFDYDADGLGAGVRGDAKRILARRKAALQLRSVRVQDFRGSAAVFEPERLVPGTDVKAKDRYQNAKAQAYFHLRDLFRNTHGAVAGGEYDPDSLISLSSAIPDVQKLCIELSQPQWKTSASGKVVVDKMPDGSLSPNRADALMILFAPRWRPIRISDALLDSEPEDA
jgi:hypothetical protein